MQILNLIRPEKSDINYNIMTFPDGEPQISLENIDRKSEVIIICRVTNPSDLFILLQVVDILKRHGVLFSLYIYYLMSMRMDRVISFDKPYSLAIIANIINGLGAKLVQVLEPHSGKVQELIKDYWGSIDMPFPNFSEYIPVFPDAGAVDRYNYLGEHSVICSKVRSLETGKLKSFVIENPDLLEKKELADRPLVIIDDLCDAGGTFVGIANKIREINPSRKLAVYVTHMVNPKGITALSEHFDEVYFTNSYFNWESIDVPSNVTVINIV